MFIYLFILLSISNQYLSAMPDCIRPEMQFNGDFNAPEINAIRRSRKLLVSWNLRALTREKCPANSITLTDNRMHFQGGSKYFTVVATISSTFYFLFGPQN